MPVLRLFAAAREAAGTGRTEIAGETVDEVVQAAVERFGPAFAAVVQTAKVWVNGDPAEPGQRVAGGDEVAILPPVSGG